MTTKEVKCLGTCGLDIRLNLMDQYQIAHVVERWESYIESLKEFRAWEAKRDAAKTWNMGREENEKWREENPMPKLAKPEFFDEIGPVLVFLRKLALPSTEKATIFDEEEEK